LKTSGSRGVLSHPWRKNKCAPRMGQPIDQRVSGLTGSMGFGLEI
jgi:hypothetical protein